MRNHLILLGLFVFQVAIGWLLGLLCLYIVRLRFHVLNALGWGLAVLFCLGYVRNVVKLSYLVVEGDLIATIPIVGSFIAIYLILSYTYRGHVSRKAAIDLEPNLIKLLSASIVTDEDHRYFVSFSRHHPHLKLPEFVRLILHYYAKILFNFDLSDPQMSQSASNLKNMMDSILARGIRKDSNILQAADIHDAAMMVSSPPTNVLREIVATLFFVNTTQRHITTDIPGNIYAQQMVFSVIALLQAVLREMDQEYIDVLNRSLANMNAAYNSGQSYSDIKNLEAVPTSAFLSAAIGK